MKPLNAAAIHKLTGLYVDIARAREAKLTPRQTEVYRMMAQGVEKVDIAEALGISVRTVDIHWYEVYRKCGVNNPVKVSLVWVACRLAEMIGE